MSTINEETSVACDVLVVDDKSDNLKLLENMLSESGYKVRLANSGKLAIRSARTKPPTLILLDIKMPDIDGYEVCRLLKADEKTRGIPIIFITALESNGDKEKGFEAGCVDYVVKPINKAEVIARVRVHTSLRLAQMKEENYASSLSELNRRLETANRLFGFLSEVNQTIVRIKERDILFKNICRIAVEIGRFRFAWIGLIDSKSGDVVPFAHHGHEEGYLAAIKTYVNEKSASMIPNQIALREGRVVICDDIGTSTVFQPKHREEALKRGYLSFAAMPIKVKGQVMGNLCIYAGEEGFFSSSENRLLEEICGDISFALDSYEAENETNEVAQELRQSEARLTATLESTTDGILTVDSNGKVLNSNRRFAEMWHIPDNLIEQRDDNALLNHVLDQLVEPEIFLKRVQQLYLEEQNDFDTLLFKDGRVFERYSRPLVLDNNNDGRVWSFRDVTERKKAEYRIKQSAAEWESTFDSITDLISIHSADHRILKVNKAFADAFKQTKNELTGKYCFEVVHKTDKPPSYCPHDKTLLRKVPSFVEVFETNLGIWMQISTSPVFNENGDIIATVHSTKDVTELKNVEKARLDAAERHTTILKTAMDGICRIDLQGRLIETNASYCSMSGYTEQELLAMSISDLEVVDSRTDIAERLKQIMAQGNAHFESRHKRKDGNIIDVEVSVQYLPADNGSFVAFIHDITERNKLQEQLMAQDRLASIGQMVSGVAHEINNPLTSVIGFSELLLARELPNDVKDDLKIVNDEAKRTSLIVRNLLTFSRQHPREKNAMHINDAIVTVLQIRAHAQSISNIKVNSYLAPDLPRVNGNLSQLQQVFFNLIINAEQAMLEVHNKGTISVITEQMGGIIKISISDDGPGINPANLKKLFTPFFTTKGVGKGTGLGLSISHGIITEHGGDISVVSEPGKGATFIIELPITEKAEK